MSASTTSRGQQLVESQLDRVVDHAVDPERPVLGPDLGHDQRGVDPVEVAVGGDERRHAVDADLRGGGERRQRLGGGRQPHGGAGFRGAEPGAEGPTAGARRGRADRHQGGRGQEHPPRRHAAPGDGLAAAPAGLVVRGRRRVGGAGGGGDQQAEGADPRQPGGDAGDGGVEAAVGPPGHGGGGGAERREGEEPGGGEWEPPPGHDAEHGSQHRGDDDRADDQRELVVRPERLDGEALDRPGCPVDDGGGHGLDRRGEPVAQTGHQLAHPEGGGRGQQPGEGSAHPPERGAGRGLGRLVRRGGRVGRSRGRRGVVVVGFGVLGRWSGRGLGHAPRSTWLRSGMRIRP